MEELAVKNETEEKVDGWLQEFSPLLLPLIIFSFTNRLLYEYFSPWFDKFIFYFLWFSVLLLIRFLWDRRKNKRFEYKTLFKSFGGFILVLLILYNVSNLMISVAEVIPQSVSSRFGPILMVGAFIFMIYLVVQFIEKHSKP